MTLTSLSVRFTFLLRRSSLHYSMRTSFTFKSSLHVTTPISLQSITSLRSLLFLFIRDIYLQESYFLLVSRNLHISFIDAFSMVVTLVIIIPMRRQALYFILVETLIPIWSHKTLHHNHSVPPYHSYRFKVHPLTHMIHWHYITKNLLYHLIDATSTSSWLDNKIILPYERDLRSYPYFSKTLQYVTTFTRSKHTLP